MVSRGRLELPWVSPLAPKASASADFAISTILASTIISNSSATKSKTKAGRFGPLYKTKTVDRKRYCATCNTSAIMPLAKSATITPMPAYIIRLRARAIFSASPAAVIKVYAAHNT